MNTKPFYSISFWLLILVGALIVVNDHPQPKITVQDCQEAENVEQTD